LILEKSKYTLKLIFFHKIHHPLKSSKNTSALASFVTPFGLVVILTGLSYMLSMFFGERKFESGIVHQTLSLFGFWQEGFFGLLGFTLQMIMILVFGYALAIFEPVNKVLRNVSKYPNDILSGALLTASVTMFAGILNWGFGLIIGALLSRFVHESLLEKRKGSNSSFLAATGYLGMAVWHGGFSGSAPLTVAGSGHFLEEKIGLIPVTETLFSTFNLGMTGGLVIVFLLVSYFMAKIVKTDTEDCASLSLKPISSGSGASLVRWAGFFMLFVLVVGLFSNGKNGLELITLNWINFLLFSMTMVAFKTWDKFNFAVKEGLKASSDILIQFPFYAGILGLLSSSGTLSELSFWIQNQTRAEYFPLITFLSSSMINLLIPSGGGQWAIQGPILMESANFLSLDSSKLVMVFSYGDQLSNLLQPFWALPLLSITGVSVRKLFPFCLIFFLSGFIFLGFGIWFLF